MTFPNVVTAFGQIYVPEPEPVIEPLVPLYRVLHDPEMGDVRDPARSLPEVFSFFDNHYTPLTKEWQLFWKALNPSLTKKQWTALLGYERAFTNGNGFGKIGDPRANFVLGEDLREELPKMEALVCGGALLTGIVSGGWLLVHTLNGLDAPPALDTLKPWEYFHATTVRPNGTIGSFPIDDFGPEIVPLLTYRPVRYPLWKLQRWTGPGLPNPYEIYL